jgi:transposase
VLTLLKIVHPVCCGIDVHNKFVVACIASTDERGITTYKVSRFSTFTSGLVKLSEWLLSNCCRNVCMESTGKYWIPVYNILEDVCRVTLAHPKYLKAIRGKKTDKKDARWIADLFKHDLVAASFMPPYDIRQLRDLMRYRAKLTAFAASEKNRLQNCLTVSNIQIANVVSDTFGKSSMRIIQNLLDSSGNADIEGLLHGSMVKKADELRLAISGTLTDEQKSKMNIILNHYSAVKECKASLESVILTLCKPYERELELVLTVPGISNPFSAIAILSEIGADMSVFATAKHLCSWAGLVPQNDESAGKKHSVRISRAGIYIKPLLVQCSNAVVRSDKHPEIRGRYLSIKKRRGHKRAIIAIARMLLTAVYHILLKDEPYNPELYIKADTLPRTRNITVDQAISFVRRFGYSVN